MHLQWKMNGYPVQTCKHFDSKYIYTYAIQASNTNKVPFFHDIVYPSLFSLILANKNLNLMEIKSGQMNSC